MSILDKIIQAKRIYQETLNSRYILTPDEQIFRDYISGKRLQRTQHTMQKIHTSALVEQIKNLMQSFDPTVANKREIREMRKILGALSKEKYPRKERKEKTK